MKRILFFVAGLLMLVSCEEDPFRAFMNKGSYSPSSGMIWDIGPVEIILDVTDRDGNSLFDESTPGNWLSTPFSATFEGQEFTWPAYLPWAQTKAYLATLRGFYVFPSWYMPTNTYLRFGELDGTKTWDTDLRIAWPDGSKDRIRVQHAFRWDQNGYPDQYTGFKLNGVPVSGNIIHLKK